LFTVGLRYLLVARGNALSYLYLFTAIDFLGFVVS
jgi:hypothetical protein